MILRQPFMLFVLMFLASSQSWSESITSSNLSKSTFNRADCDGSEDIVASWGIATSTAATSYTITLELRDGSSVETACPTGIGSSNGEQLESVTANNTLGELEVSFSVPASDIFNDDACGDTGEREIKVLCLYVKDQSNINVATDGAVISYDTIMPTDLEVSNIQPGDGKFQFDISGGDPSGNKLLSYLVSYRSCDSEATSEASDGGARFDGGITVDAGASVVADAGASQYGDAGTSDDNSDSGTSADSNLDAGTASADGGEIHTNIGSPMTDARDGGTVNADSLCDAQGDFETMTSSSATLSVNDLNNDEKYEFKVMATDDFGNEGPETGLFTATPINEVSVLDVYNGAVNPWGFDCQQSKTLPLYAFFIFVLLFITKRRNKKMLGKTGFIVLLIYATGYAPMSLAETGQVSFSLNGGPYQPAIDSEVVNGEPIFPIYDCFFSNETLSLLHLDFGYQFLDGFGNFQVGLGLGYAQARGQAQTADLLTTGQCGDESSGSVALHLLEFRPYVAYYLDPMYLKWGIPFIPYVKGGVAAFMYGWTHDGELDEGGASQGHYATGFRPAIDTSLGVLMALDWLEPAVTRRARASGAYETAYALFEVAYVSTAEFDIEGLVLSASDIYWDSQQPLMMRFGIMVEFP